MRKFFQKGWIGLLWVLLGSDVMMVSSAAPVVKGDSRPAKADPSLPNSLSPNTLPNGPPTLSNNQLVASLTVPVVVDTYVATKLGKTLQYTVNAEKHRFNTFQLGQVLSALAKDKRRGATLPVAVLLDPSLSLNEVSALARLVQRSGMRYARYFVYQTNRSMLAELQFNSVKVFPDNAFPRARLEAEMMAAPK